MRIEDTDQDRLVPESLPAILEILRFLNLPWDEGLEAGGSYGPYVQSERLALYQEYAKKLIDQNKAYFCFCTPKRLEEMRATQQKRGLAPKYDRTCFNLSEKEVAQKIISKTPHTARLRIPDKGETSWVDLIHGKIVFKNEVLDDHILLKSDGWPTYHLAVVVDDHLMEITHVLRGDEWISSTPKHLLLYQALGWEPPEFGHLPIVVGSDKQKLSKRHGAKSVLEYQGEGYLPETIINFMALLGWSPKSNEEIFSLEELIKTFDISHVNSTNPVFNLEKLDWFNSQWIRKLSHKELIERLGPFVPKTWDRQTLKAVLPLVTERIFKLSDFPEWTRFFFEEPKFDPGLIKGKQSASWRNLLAGISEVYENISSWKTSELENLGRTVSENTGLSPKDSFMILRLAVSGKSVGPPLFESLEILGKASVLKRLKKAVKKAG